KSEAKKKMGGKSLLPHFRRIDFCDQNLAVGEFKESVKVCVRERGHETYRKKQDWFAATSQGIPHVVVVATRMRSFPENATRLVHRFSNGSAADPAEVVAFFREHGDDGRIPSGQKPIGKIVAIGDKPAHGGCGAVTTVDQRSDHAMEPRFSRLAVRVREDKNFDVGRKLRNGIAEIVDFFPPPDRFACKKNCSFDARLRGDASYSAGGRIVFGSENEEQFVV